MADNMKEDSRPEPPGKVCRYRSLSVKLAGLTILIIIAGGLLALIPSLSNFRITWLKDRIAMAEIASLAVQAAPQGKVAEPLREELLRSAGVMVVAIKRGGRRQLVLQSMTAPMIQARYDLRDTSPLRAAADMIATFWHRGARAIVVVDTPPNIEAEFIELALDERPLHAALVHHGLMWLRYGLFIAAIAGLLIYLALHRLFVHPLSRLARRMQRFAADPEAMQGPVASGRRDEIGAMEATFDAMQARLRELLREKSRLAALGLAVSKISHELRNILFSAQLVSDRLADSEDRVVRRLAPKLLASLDRAISYCTATLKYGKLTEPAPKRSMLALKPLVDEVIDSLPASAQVRHVNEVPRDLRIDADGEQMQRVLLNLLRNAQEAIEAAQGQGEVRVRARRERRVVIVEVSDTGPGLPQKARVHLFEPFRGAARSGGTGLGLSIVREIIELHGGSIDLKEHAPDQPGATFVLSIPDRLEVVSQASQDAGERQRA